MFDKLKDMASLMGQAREMKAKMAQLQAELAEKTVEADAGAGAVHVTVNGKLEVVRITLDPPLLAALAGTGADTDQAMVEELMVAAVNAALVKAQELVRTETSRALGLNLPGMDQLLGG